MGGGGGGRGVWSGGGEGEEEKEETVTKRLTRRQPARLNHRTMFSCVQSLRMLPVKEKYIIQQAVSLIKSILLTKPC